MSYLKVTLIDVGWGDSIFIESVNHDNKPRYALIDSNDDGAYQPSIIFLKKYLRIPTKDLASRKPELFVTKTLHFLLQNGLIVLYAKHWK